MNATVVPAASRLPEDQRTWLELGLTQAGGKLPNFMGDNVRIDDAVIDSCLKAGLVEQWMYNPLKPNWKVCRLTEAGRLALNPAPVIRVDFTRWQRDDSVNLPDNELVAAASK